MVEAADKPPRVAPRPEDLADWHAHLAGERDAMNRIQERHGRAILLYVWRTCRERNYTLDADEICQEAFRHLLTTARHLRNLLAISNDPGELERLRHAFFQLDRSAGKSQPPSAGADPDEDDEFADVDDLVTWLRRLKVTGPARRSPTPLGPVEWRQLVAEVIDSKRDQMHIRRRLRDCAGSRMLDAVKTRRKKFASLPDEHDPVAPSMDRPTELEEQLRILEQCKERLSATQRVVLEHHLQGLPNTQIARELGLPDGTVASHIHRAVKALSDCATEHRGRD